MVSFSSVIEYPLEFLVPSKEGPYKDAVDQTLYHVVTVCTAVSYAVFHAGLVTNSIAILAFSVGAGASALLGGRKAIELVGHKFPQISSRSFSGNILERIAQIWLRQVVMIIGMVVGFSCYVYTGYLMGIPIKLS